jgi:hypothetical protein
MNPKLKELLTAIVSGVTDHGGSVSKTKLLKLLYLFDIEWYRNHKETFSGFDWKFYLLGPWTDEYDPTLEKYEANGSLERQKGRDEYGTEFITTKEVVRLRDLFGTRDEEIILEDLIRTWSKVPTAEILDHVYFRTEPMQDTVRNEKLDFSKVAPEPPRRYRRAMSGLSQKQLDAIRAKIAERLKPIREREQSLTSFVSPEYDNEFLEGMEQLERIR